MRAVLPKQAAVWGRWLHIYLSMTSFAILFFFAVTGITLNHPDWFGVKENSVRRQGQGPARCDQAKLEVVEHLRKTHGVRGALTDYRIDEAQCGVSFKGPGYSADTFVDRATGRYEITESRMGLVAVINDLHKGRDSGAGWSMMIDVSAVLMVLVSLTGFVLIFFLGKKRASGLMAAAMGAVACYAVYAIWVP